VEVLRFYLELDTRRGPERTTSATALAPGVPFRLHFVASRHGFLYLVAPAGDSDTPTTLLTNHARPGSAAKDNAISAGADYVVPLESHTWLWLGRSSSVTKVTVVYSPTRLREPACFAAEPLCALTPGEWSWIETLRRASDSEVLVAEDTQTVSEIVLVPGARPVDKPVAFDIDLRLKPGTPKGDRP
jgi:hypothetical protein